MKRIYLAIPYSFNPDYSNRIVNKVAAKLMSDGYAVYSPISQGHVIADHLADNLRKDSVWWLERVLPFIDVCDEVWFVVIGSCGDELINQSVGCMAELERARTKNKRTGIVTVDVHGGIQSINR